MKSVFDSVVPLFSCKDILFLVEEDDLQQLENLAYKQSFESGGLPSYECSLGM